MSTASAQAGTAGDELARFRAGVRTWAQVHVPAGWAETYAEASEAEYNEFQRWWLRELQAAGYAAPHWSKKWGGSDLDLAHQIVLYEELTLAGAPGMRTFYVAIHHTYATLSEWGSDAQCERFLPRILAGDEIWCQGFSEPGAGSDLASLRTRAARDGDDYVVNGQKVWSSLAEHADWCLLLVRTDPDAPKRKGISFLLLDLHSEGVERRPIKQASGESEFCEIFLTDVRVPVSQRVGDENDGWRIAQSTLTAERGTTLLDISARLDQSLGWLIEQARTLETEPGVFAIEDVAVRETLARLRTEVTILQLLCRKVINDLLQRGGAGPEASLIKIYHSELLQRVAKFGVEISDVSAHEFSKKTMTSGFESGKWLIDYIVAWAWLIGGGTNNIQRNVVGERVLGLPREPWA